MRGLTLRKRTFVVMWIHLKDPRNTRTVRLVPTLNTRDEKTSLNLRKREKREIKGGQKGLELRGVPGYLRP